VRLIVIDGFSGLIIDQYACLFIGQDSGCLKTQSHTNALSYL